jgi:hypothetical protein
MAIVTLIHSADPAGTHNHRVIAGRHGVRIAQYHATRATTGRTGALTSRRSSPAVTVSLTAQFHIWSPRKRRLFVTAASAGDTVRRAFSTPMGGQA